MEVRRSLCCISSVLVHSEGSVNALLVSHSLFCFSTVVWDLLEYVDICGSCPTLSNFESQTIKIKARFSESTGVCPRRWFHRHEPARNRPPETQMWLDSWGVVVIRRSAALSGLLIHYNRFLVKWNWSFFPAWHFRVGRRKRRNTEQLWRGDCGSLFSRSARYFTKIRYNSLLVPGARHLQGFMLHKRSFMKQSFQKCLAHHRINMELKCGTSVIFISLPVHRTWMHQWKWHGQFSRCHSWLMNNEPMLLALWTWCSFDLHVSCKVKAKSDLIAPWWLDAV